MTSPLLQAFDAILAEGAREGTGLGALPAEFCVPHDARR